MISRYALVKNGVVEQITLWDGQNAWRPAKGEAIQCPDDIHLGATYDGSMFTNPEPVQSGTVEEKVGPDNLTDSERVTFKTLAAKVAG